MVNQQCNCKLLQHQIKIFKIPGTKPNPSVIGKMSKNKYTTPYRQQQHKIFNYSQSTIENLREEIQGTKGSAKNPLNKNQHPPKIT